MKRRSALLIGAHVLCVALYIWSLYLPAFIFPQVPSFDQSGADVLLKGWAAVLFLDPRWYANILFIICIMTNLSDFGMRRAPLIGLALVISTFVFTVHYFPHERAIPVPRLGAAVYVWAAALIPVFLISLFMRGPNDPAGLKHPPE